MKNLEQIRARNVLKFSNSGAIRGDDGGEVIKKIPPLIMNNGLLAATAFSFGEKEGWQKTFDAIACHLADPEIAIVPQSTDDRTKLMDFLTGNEANSETLKLATNETMAWLGYARRFVKKD